MAPANWDEVSARLLMAIKDIAALPSGDLVRGMAEEVATDDLRSLAAADGLSALSELESSLDVRSRRILCRLALSAIGRNRHQAELMIAFGAAITNTSPLQIEVTRQHWEAFAVSFLRSLEQELDPALVGVVLEWEGVPIDSFRLSSAAGVLAAVTEFRRRPPSPLATLNPGTTRVLFAAKLRSRALGEDPDEALIAEWDRKAPRASRQLQSALLIPLERIEDLAPEISVRTTPLVALENVPTAFVYQDIRNLASRKRGTWKVDEEAVYVDGQAVSVADPFIDLGQIQALADRLNSKV